MDNAIAGAIRTLGIEHVWYKDQDGKKFCNKDNQKWPCDDALALTAIESQSRRIIAYDADMQNLRHDVRLLQESYNTLLSESSSTIAQLKKELGETLVDRTVPKNTGSIRNKHKKPSLRSQLRSSTPLARVSPKFNRELLATG